MKIISNINQIKKMRRAVVALGVFDGVHLAHRRILKYAVRLAHKIKGKSVVVTFWPHPQREDSLYSLEHRLRLIEELGIQICIVIRFSKTFSRIPAEDFIRDILVKKIGAYYICAGRNFRFGKSAQGDFRTLIRLANLYKFKVKIFGVIKVGARPISSTYIRRLITRGSLRVAERLLCRPVSVLGVVIRGASLGKRLGFPTANIDPHHEVLPPSGVYAVGAILNNRKLNGICYIGKKPTFNKKQLRAHVHIEVYIYNFKGNIYSRFLEIQFVKKIRKEKKFASCQQLAWQISKDAILAQDLLKSLH